MNLETLKAKLASVKERFQSYGMVVPVAVSLIALFLVAGGILLAIQLTKPQTAAPSPQPQQVAARPLFLEVTNPSDGTVVNEKNLTVSGRTLPNTTVVAFTDNDENTVESDNHGNFTANVNLDGGINFLTISALGDGSDDKKLMMSVVYDTSGS